MAPVNPSLTPRQSGTSESCPNTISGGAVAGIVIGTFAGTLFLVWLVRRCGLSSVWGGGEPDYDRHVSTTQTSRGRRKRRHGSDVAYAEKPSSSTRRYRDDVRRPAKVYMT